VTGLRDPPTSGPPDLRLLPAAVAVWLVALAAPAFAPRLLFVGAAWGAALGLVAVSHKTARSTAVGAVLLCAAAAGAASGARVAAVRQGPLPGLAADRAVATVDLVLTDDPRRSTPRPTAVHYGPPVVVATARVERVVARGSAVRVRSPLIVVTDDSWLGLLPGTRLRTTGRLAPPTRPGEMTAVLSVSGTPQVVAAPGPVQRAAGRLRAGLRDAVAGLPSAERGLVPGLVVGDTSQLPDSVAADFRTTGLTHLVAVSGANLAIVLGVVLASVRWLGMRRRLLPWVGAAVVAGFVVLARPQPSVLRAAVTGLVALAALGGGRRRLAVPALAGAILTLVLVDPWLARSYGFALSVLATAGLLLVAPGWRDRLARWLPQPLADAVAVPAAAQLACAPVIVMISGQVSLVAVPANLLAAPAVAPATVAGVLASVTAPLSMPVARVFGHLAGVPAAWLVLIATRGATLPGAALPWPDGLGGALVLAALTVLGTGVAPRVARRGGVVSRGAAVAVVAVLGVAAARPVVSPGWPPPGWLLVVCDVGQGDALVLNAGPATAVVIDAGPEPRAVDRCLHDLGVRRIPLLLLTHMHADHVEGLPGVLHGRSVGAVETGPLDEPPQDAADVRRWVAAARLPMSRATVGERRSVGGVSWQVLWPERIIREESIPNNNSVVVMAVSAGVRMLLAGDVEPVSQRAILALGYNLRADVYKVAHHGSSHQAPAFARAVSPGVAIVSVGVGNPYGHPAAGTLAQLAAGGARVLRTDHDGDVAVVGPRQRLGVVGRRGAGIPAPASAASTPGERAPPRALTAARLVVAGSVRGPCDAGADACRRALRAAHSGHAGPRARGPPRGAGSGSGGRCRAGR